MKRWQFALQQPESSSPKLMDLDLKGRSVLISGASKGIGRAVAEEFAREGCGLFLVSRTAADLERARDEIRARHNVPVEIHAADLARPEARQAVVEKAGAIDILINNAGAIPKGDLLELDDARWREAWDLKVFGYINMCRDFYRAMQARKSGVIINIIGFSSEKLDYDYLAGSTGNAGLVAFTRALGSLSIEYGVRVLGVNPGYVETERAVRGLRIRAQKELGDPEKWPDLVRDLWPRGKMIKPKEIADVVTFLASGPRQRHVRADRHRRCGLRVALLRAACHPASSGSWNVERPMKIYWPIGLTREMPGRTNRSDLFDQTLNEYARAVMGPERRGHHRAG